MRTALIMSTAFLAVTGAGIMVLTDVVAQPASKTHTQQRLDELLRQRRDTLARAVDVQTAYYRDGNCELEDVLAMQRRLQEAALDAAKTREERVEVLEEQLKSVESAVSLANTRFESGAVTKVTVLQARADLLSVQIQLERERH